MIVHLHITRNYSLAMSEVVMESIHCGSVLPLYASQWTFVAVISIPRL